jgi:hypothetical protein
MELPTTEQPGGSSREEHEAGEDSMGAGILDLEIDRAHSARMYDYFLGGNTNFPADREAAAQAMRAFPAARISARLNRQFMQRSTRYLAEAGMDQFLDIGTGIPTSPNLHEIAQQVNPAARIVYTDNDPIVLAHAAALMRSTPEGATTYVQSDLTRPGELLTATGITSALDFRRPIALSLNAVLHFIPDDLGAHSIVETLKSELVPGSTLAITHSTPDFDPASVNRATAAYRAAGTRGQPRTRAEFALFLEGWELIPPGITVSTRWHPSPDDEFADATDAEVSCYVALARKPPHPARSHADGVNLR